EAAGRIAAIAEAAVADHGYFAWALSGGNTPVATYRMLAQSLGASGSTGAVPMSSSPTNASCLTTTPTATTASPRKRC
ncbi:6-phosphogluconolactonase, partial [Methylogaea oryzae]|uniref:6-phosphogluconolactonase n=1 Tax=Methylogaea oryzae TaxID=1295382 RepID=UPI00156B46E9